MAGLRRRHLSESQQALLGTDPNDEDHDADGVCDGENQVGTCTAAGPAGPYGPNTDYGKRDIIFLTYWQKATGVLNYYRIWMEHARIRNPKVRMLIYVPSTYMPVTRNLTLLNETNDALRTRFQREVILPMRKVISSFSSLPISSSRAFSYRLYALL